MKRVTDIIFSNGKNLNMPKGIGMFLRDSDIDGFVKISHVINGESIENNCQYINKDNIYSIVCREDL